MKKTGYEIIKMIKKGKEPKKIKNKNNCIYEFNKIMNTYTYNDCLCLDLIQCLNDKFEIINK